MASESNTVPAETNGPNRLPPLQAIPEDIQVNNAADAADICWATLEAFVNGKVNDRFVKAVATVSNAGAKCSQVVQQRLPRRQRS